MHNLYAGLPRSGNALFKQCGLSLVTFSFGATHSGRQEEILHIDDDHR